MIIWLVSMECATINEAGGIKDVTFALCKELSILGHDVTLFTPRFGCTKIKDLTNIKNNASFSYVFLCGANHKVNYTTATNKDYPFKVVLIEHEAFLEKSDIYTYTKAEEKLDSTHTSGTGHKDFHFLDCVLCSAVAKYGAISATPNIIHCQDASTALTPAYIAQEKLNNNKLFNKTKCFVTIHNAGPSYHHEFYSVGDACHNTQLPRDWIERASSDWRVEPFLLAAPFSTLTTVSNEYAAELLDPKNTDTTDNLNTQFYKRKISIIGITNGIDFDIYNPTNKSVSLLPYEFDIARGNFFGKTECKKLFLSDSIYNNVTNNKNTVQDSNITTYGRINTSIDNKNTPTIFVYHGRLATQKGVTVLLDAMGELLKKSTNAKIIIIGQGERDIENAIIRFTAVHDGDALFFNGYNEPLARLVIAAGDFIVLPSFFEPCCQLDLIAQLYGTIPIAHATGGLKKIINNKTGFLYEENDSTHLLKIMEKANDLKTNHKDALLLMMQFAYQYIKDNFNWHSIVKDKYISLYKDN